MAEPIDARYREKMNAIADALDRVLNGEIGPKKLAFTLLVAEFGHIDGGRVNYISNAQRADMIAMIKEYLARAEGRYADPGASEQ